MNCVAARELWYYSVVVHWLPTYALREKRNVDTILIINWTSTNTQTHTHAHTRANKWTNKFICILILQNLKFIWSEVSHTKVYVCGRVHAIATGHSFRLQCINESSKMNSWIQTNVKISKFRTQLFIES